MAEAEAEIAREKARAKTRAKARQKARQEQLWTAAAQGLEIPADCTVRGIPSSYFASQLLCVAVCNGHAATLTRLLQSHRAVVHAADAALLESVALDPHRGKQMLWRATEYDAAAAVAVLVQAKVSPNGVDDDEAAPIDYALNLGHMCAVEILLALKADVTGFAGSRALWRAVHGGHISSVQRLLQVKVEVHGLSWPICAAVRNGSKPLIQLLVAAKATMTAHHHFLYAVCHGSSVQRLLEAKVDVHHARCSSLDGAILRGRVRPVQRLLQVDADVRDDRFDFLDLALCRGHVRIVQQLLDANAVLLYRSRIVFRHTPLLVAAKNGRVSVVQYLTRIKASLDHMDALHRTAMLVAANRGHAAVVQVLIAAKADMNVADLQLRTPAMIAARRGQVGVISHLLDAKADMDTPNQHGHTPLTIAQNVGQHAVVRLLTRQPAPSICASVETGP